MSRMPVSQGTEEQARLLCDICRYDRHADPHDQLKEIGRYFDLAGSAFLVVDPQGRVIQVNRILCELLGYSPQELSGKDFVEMASPSDRREDDRALLSRVIAGELDANAAIPRPFIASDGQTHYLDWHVSVLEGPEGNVIGVIGSGHDVTKRMATEAELERQKSLLTNVISYIPQHVFWKGTDLRYGGCNRNFAIVAGVGTPENIVGKLDSELAWTPEETAAYNEFDRRVIEGGETLENIEESQRRADGRTTTVLTSKVPLRGLDGKTIGVLGLYADITERKELEEALRESEEKFRVLFEKAGDAIMLEGESGFIQCNDACKRMFGLESKEYLVGKSPAEVSAPVQSDGEPSAEAARRHAQEALDTGMARFEWMCQKLDGTVFPAEVTLSRVRFHDRDVIHVVVRDISDRKRMEKSLQKKSQDLSQRIKELKCLVGIAKLRDETSLSLGEFLQKAIELVPNAFQYADKAAAKITVENESYQTNGYVDNPSMHETKIDVFGEVKGTIRAGYVDTVPEPDGGLLHEEIDLMSRISRDIGVFLESRRAEHMLRRTVAQYTAMINTVPAFMYLKNADNKYVTVNEAFSKAVGRPVSDFIGSTGDGVLPGSMAEEFSALDAAVMAEDRRFVQHEERIDELSDEPQWISATRVPVHDDKGAVTGMVGLIQDVTEYRLNREQLVQADKLAAIGTLAAGVAHEINNPIGFISSNLNTMSKYLKKICAYCALHGGEETDELKKMHVMLEDFQDAVAESIDGASRVRRIVSDLKNFSRADKSEKESMNVLEGLESTLNIVWNELKYKCTVEKEYGEVPDVLCMPNQINQVFMNLLINAGQAIVGEGGVIRIRTWAEGGWVYISIKDNGSGIEAKHLSKIFEPFFTTKEVGKGTGLGLSLAYDIVKKHAGEIEVQSEVGKGTEFIVRLPVKGPEDE